MKLVKDIEKDLQKEKISEKEAEEAFVKILKWIGENPDREGLKSTPKRLVKAFKEYFKGYSEDANLILQKTFGDNEKRTPLTPEKRALLNVSYATNFEKWKFDFTANYIGKSRIPDNIVANANFSSPFRLLNSQITYKWNNADVYIGAENITNYIQSNPIIDPENPFGQDFDASLIWGPVMGRNIYLGFRYNIK